LLRGAGITRRVTFRNLRQTFRSDIVASTDDLLYASEQAGHASVKITGDYYAHYRPGQKRHIKSFAAIVLNRPSGSINLLVPVENLTCPTMTEFERHPRHVSK
jgi:hypothetical protein